MQIRSSVSTNGALRSSSLEFLRHHQIDSKLRSRQHASRFLISNLRGLEQEGFKTELESIQQLGPKYETMF